MDFNNMIDRDFRGCISISKGNELLFRKAYGYRDLSNEIPNTTDTRFATASAGKVFIGTGILQLIEKGKLRFTDTIGELLELDWKRIDSGITVKQLLTHTSGIPDYFDESIMDEYEELWRDYPNYKIRTSADLLPLFMDKPMMYEKGERFQYNNTGFVVLGLIIEKVTGKPFDNYLKEYIFSPSGMGRTGYFELDRLPANCAANYIWDEERKEYYTNIYSVDVKGTGAGGVFTTVADVELFWKALLSGRLLSAEMTDEMLRIQSTSEDEDNYGYGIWISKKYEDCILPYFTGMDPGVTFISTYKRDEELNITVVSNFGDNVWKIKNDILNGLTEKV